MNVYHVINCMSKDTFYLDQFPFLTLNAPMATKVVCFSRLLNVQEAYMANSVDPDQTAPIGAVCSGSTLFASILYSSITLGNYLQQTTSADDIFRCIFFHGALRVNSKFYLCSQIYLKPIKLLFPLGSVMKHAI